MKKIIDIIFILAFFSIIVLPLIFMDHTPDKVSEIDNKMLAKIETTDAKTFVTTAEAYVNDRIGFRMEALHCYQVINDKCFGLMEHPSYMYGKDGHVFYKAGIYVNDYQRLNRYWVDVWSKEFASGLAGFQEYAESKDKTFIYLLLPDKKTIYPEYFPSEYNIKPGPSRTEMVLTELDNFGVNYFWAKDTMLEAKETMLVNNKKYDAEHWNENGAFVVFSKLYEILRQTHPQIDPLDVDDFEVGEELMTSLPTSHFEIDELVPSYTLKESTAVNDTDWFIKNAVFPSQRGNYVTRFVNPEKADKPKILVIHDSYIMKKEKFFTENFSEATFLHRYNLLNQEVFEYYVDLLDPDIIIYENPERSWQIDLHQPYTFAAK